MRKLIILAIFIFSCLIDSAQISRDTLSFEIQRAKINGMLAERAKKIDEYSQSLNASTGFLGTRTKSDLKQSNEILEDVVKIDDDVYKQLKILLDLKVYQLKQAQQHSNKIQASVQKYIATIDTLRKQTEKLKHSTEKQNFGPTWVKWIFISLLIIQLLIILNLMKRKGK